MTRNQGKNKASGAGFTMIELMVVLMILAILASWGAATYQKQSRIARLNAAKSALMEDADYLNHFYSRYYRYNLESAAKSGQDQSNRGRGNCPELPKTQVVGFKIGFNPDHLNSCGSERYILYAIPDETYEKQEKRYLRMDENGNITLCRPQKDGEEGDDVCDLF